jgi:hypothetical protein
MSSRTRYLCLRSIHFAKKSNQKKATPVPRFFRDKACEKNPFRASDLSGDGRNSQLRTIKRNCSNIAHRLH